MSEALQEGECERCRQLEERVKRLEHDLRDKQAAVTLAIQNAERLRERLRKAEQQLGPRR